MALMDFIKKQFIDIIEWTEDGDGTLAWRFPMEDREIQNGGSLTVRESQMAMFVNEGKVADVFGPGRYTLTTATLPILTYLQNWDKLFQSPFKSDVYFFSTRQQIDQRWGTTPAGDDPRQGLRRRAPARVRQLRYRIADPKPVPQRDLGHARALHRRRARRPAARADAAAHLRRGRRERHRRSSTSPPTRSSSRRRSQEATAPAFAKLGLKLESVTMQNVSLPEELQKILDQKIGMGMVGSDMGKFMQYQTAQAIPKFAEGAGQGGGVVGDAMGLGAGVALGQVMANQLSQGLAAAAPARRQLPRPRRRPRASSPKT